MNDNGLDMVGVCLLAYSSTVMRHFVVANYDRTTRALTIPLALQGGLPTLLSLVFVPVFFWLPIYFVLKMGWYGLVVWLSSLVVFWVATKIAGLHRLLFFHFWLAIVAGVVGVYLTMRSI